MKYLNLIMLFSILFVSSVQASNERVNGLTIKFIRAVGNYSAGTTYDNTIELHFTTPLIWPEGSLCTITYRVMIDSKNNHLISAAYMAYASGFKVNINADDALPIRNGACELSYLDIVK
ncbi:MULTISPECIES: hypothetical protein [unclassified Colwellia]|uniref:hypothetical protein n=1 Tax=unclassified Colwellia TaxID=196834 RepID=UPI0015F45F9A|nr:MULTISPECIES: hypothetical protein [unclassified Colwellia]MBA6231372.1 hypothetical protein [Colwellia sp. MB02u-7]MBA6235981.1 hypothetical protein [Colwellia sp. MB02u-11]MBA6297938.1 hypothetical protein [Colwellia sp. MB3u-22]MBA6309443.1 hypothetical protein [Colwellia sp. MB3u-64]